MTIRRKCCISNQRERRRPEAPAERAVTFDQSGRAPTDNLDGALSIHRDCFGDAAESIKPTPSMGAQFAELLGVGHQNLIG